LYSFLIILKNNSMKKSKSLEERLLEIGRMAMLINQEQMLPQAR